MEITDVITKLREYGYYILYENLQVRYLGSPICKFEIVGINFIVDIKKKDFDDSSSRAINFLYVNRIIPKDYKYFVYLPLYTNDELEELMERYISPIYIFINDIEKIKEYISPMKNIECNTVRDFANLMWLSDDEMSKIKVIYTPYDIYKKNYDFLISIRDKFDAPDIIKKIQRVNKMIMENKLIFNKTGLDNLFPFSSVDKTENPTKVNLNSFGTVIFNRKYYKSDFKQLPRQ